MSSVLCGCGTFNWTGHRPPTDPDTTSTIKVAFKDGACLLDFSEIKTQISTTFGQGHIWLLAQPSPPAATFDENGIDISQFLFQDFIRPVPSKTTFHWTANPNFTSGIPHSYDVHVTWTKADGAKQACVSTDPYIVNRGASANQ